MTDTDKPTMAALAVLTILQTVMLTALYAGVAPHPPANVPGLFGMAPFLAASLSAAAAALIVGNGRGGRVLTVLAVLLALISFGPQKYLDAQFPLIWPAVIAAQIAMIVLLHRQLRKPSYKLAQANSTGPKP